MDRDEMSLRYVIVNVLISNVKCSSIQSLLFEIFVILLKPNISCTLKMYLQLKYLSRKYV